jgi:hypothetical protein
MKRSDRMSLVLIGWVAVAAVMVPTCRCEEGMWLPYDLPDEVLDRMHDMGLELARYEIYNDSGTGVANAVVSVGATGSFVSPNGLILTNHHVAFGAVQRISTPEQNYIEDGFLAGSMAEELPAHGYVAYILQSSEDVTERISMAVRDYMSPSDRYDVIEKAKKIIIADAEEDRDIYCEVNDFYGGAQYMLDTYLKLPDVRVVYVPSRAIGEYGGDIDNWMWPRHTGDFSFLRAYVAPDGSPAEYSEKNVPYRPARYLRVAPEGLRDGEFSVIIGFPGKTHRYLTSHALAHYRNFEYPQRIGLYKKMVAILEEQSRRDPVAAVRVAGWLKGINNRLKNNEGMLDGFRGLDLVEQRKAWEAEAEAKLMARPDALKLYKATVDDYRALYEDLATHGVKDLLLSSLLGRGPLLGQALLLYKWSVERQKDDMDRDPDFMDRKIPDLKRKITVFQGGYHEGSDLAVTKMLLTEMIALPEGGRVEFINHTFGGKTGSDLDEALDGFLGGLYAETKVDELDQRLRMFEMSEAQLVGENDPLIALAKRFYDENEQRIERDKAFKGSLSILTPRWMEIIADIRERDTYPDANGTMRLNFGVVKGYSPVDQISYKPFTTLRGVAEKHTGVPPFDCPDRILELVAGSARGPYFDAVVGDVPVNILTTHDSTGGNSGSPVLNGRGELVGCLFDGVYEAMTSDFEFMPEITRSISVDIRYVLYITGQVDHADNVLEELGLAE